MPLVFFTGLLFGSFANACIYRWPREASVARGRSRCPHCENIIPWHDNIPVLSWMFLLGKCRRCRGSISFRYPFVELLCGVAFVFAAKKFELPQFAAAAFFLWGLLVVFWVDFDHRIIPDEISYPFTLIGILLSPWLSIVPDDQLLGLLYEKGFSVPQPLAQSLIGALVGGGIIVGIRVVGQAIYKEEAMGFGDVKLLALIGAWLGIMGAFTTLFVAALIGGVVSMVLLVTKKATRRSHIPFGPFLVLGALYFLFLGKA